MRRGIERLTSTVGVCLIGIFVGTASAQQAPPAQQAATTTKTTKVSNFEVISVDGNQLVVRGPAGTNEYTVPETFRFNVDGKEMSVHDLKPGMKGTAAVTTITTVKPVTVTEVRNGTVMSRTGNSIVVRTDDGIRMFSEGELDKRGVTITRNGQPINITDLRANDRLTATIVTSKPPQVMTEREVSATLAKAGDAAAGAASATAGAAKSAAGAAARAVTPNPSPATGAAAPSAPAGTTGAAEAPKRLPRTASSQPLVGVAGVVLLAIGAGLTLRRRRVAH